jgi:hypothetical protein
MCINLLECSINLLEWASMCWNWDWKYLQQLQCGMNCWDGDWKWHQHLEGASNVGIETDASLGLETDLCGFKSWLLTPCWWGVCEELMRTSLSPLTYLFALFSMCYLPEWNIVNNNSKYTEYKWWYKWDANVLKNWTFEVSIAGSYYSFCPSSLFTLFETFYFCELFEHKALIYKINLYPCYSWHFFKGKILC